MASPDTNRKLRSARIDQGWHSQEQAAQALSAIGQDILEDPHFCISVRTYRRWESASPGWPRPDTATVLSAAFGRSPADLGFTPSAGRPCGPDAREDPLKRRNFLAAGSAGALAAIHAAPAGAVPHSRVDPQLVGYFGQQLTGHAAADMLLDPRDLIGTVGDQHRLIAGLARTADGPVRDDLTRVGAAYAVLAGWLHQDAGDWTAARSWHASALADAQTIDDPDLHAYTLANLSYLHTELGDGRAAVALCTRGLLLPGIPPIARMQLMYQQAHGHSLLGDRGAVDRLLDAAETTARSRPEQPPAPWSRTGAITNSLFFDIQRATCYGRLGLHAQAQPLWERVTSAVPDSARRRAGIYLARQASAHVALGDPEQALVLAAESAQIAAESGSVRHLGELATLRTRMMPWQKGPLAAQFEQAFQPVSG